MHQSLGLAEALHKFLKYYSVGAYLFCFICYENKSLARGILLRFDTEQFVLLRYDCERRAIDQRFSGCQPLAVTSAGIDQAGLTIGIAWHLTQAMVPEVVPAAQFPLLQAFSQQAELLPEFAAAPHGASTYRAG
jgi:hypothetical protein